MLFCSSLIKPPSLSGGLTFRKRGEKAVANQFKLEQVKILKEKIERAKSIVLVDYQGIKVKDDTELRKQMRENGAEYVVAKNRLFKIALKEAGIDANFDEILEGNTSFAFGYADPVAPAKVAYEFGKGKEIFNIKAGLLEGQRVSAAQVEGLAKLPSRDVLLSQVLYGMLGPITKLAYAFNALAEKKETAAE